MLLDDGYHLLSPLCCKMIFPFGYFEQAYSSVLGPSRSVTTWDGTVTTCHAGLALLLTYLEGTIYIMHLSLVNNLKELDWVNLMKNVGQNTGKFWWREISSHKFWNSVRAYGGMEWESFILPADDRADDGQKPCLAYIYATSPCLKIREDIHKANSFFPS